MESYGGFRRFARGGFIWWMSFVGLGGMGGLGGDGWLAFPMAVT